MLINAQLLLQFQRCQRRPFLDIYGDYQQREVPNELALKIQQDKMLHHQRIVKKLCYYEPDYPPKDWTAGAAATISLMQQGVSYIRRGVLLTTYREKYTLLSRPDLLVKQPGESRFGAWNYVPVDIELGKRPKQEYQVLMAFHAEVLATVQDVTLSKAGLILRDKDQTYVVDLDKWTPQMLDILDEYTQVVESVDAPEIFISRQKQLIWQQFLNLVNQYPQAPIYHFCAYEVDTVKNLGKLYRTPHSQIRPILSRFIDIYEQLIQSVALPIDSYALKAIARWLGFAWREQEANGAKCIYWYDKWLETGDRSLLTIIQDYNEDDCRATRTVKDWLVSFFKDQSNNINLSQS